MNIELAILNDGGVMLTSDAPMPHTVKRVEFYREQRLFMLVYNVKSDDDQADELMHYEVPKGMANKVERSPNMIIYTLFKDHPPIGYKVPLIKVGNLY